MIPKEELLKWRHTLLTVTFHFQLLVNAEEITALGMQLREHLIVDYSTMARSARQWIFTIVQAQRELEAHRQCKVSCEDVATYVNNSITVATDPSMEKDEKDDKEALTDNFVRSALDIYSILLSDRITAKLIENADEEWGLSSPLNAIAKLHVIAKNGKADPQWVIMCIIDGVKSGLHSAGAFGHRALKGEGINKGFVDLFLLKSKLRKYLLQDFLNARALPSAIKEKLRQVYADHDSFRKECPYKSEGRQWQVGWDDSAIYAATFIEDAIYGKDWPSPCEFALIFVGLLLNKNFRWASGTPPTPGGSPRPSRQFSRGVFADRSCNSNSHFANSWVRVLRPCPLRESALENHAPLPKTSRAVSLGVGSPAAEGIKR